MNPSRRTKQREVPRGRDPYWTAWHLLFERLVMQRSPKSFEVRREVPLGNTSPTLDLLLLRRRQGPKADRGARVLRGLWPTIADTMILEFKSSARAVRRGELFRLLGYAALYVDEARKGKAAGVRLGVVVANVTPSLSEELWALGARLPKREGGYAVVKTKPFETVLAVVDEVAKAERDELLGVFGHGELRSVGDKLGWKREVGANMAAIKSLPGHDKVLKKMLASFPAEDRLAGLAVEDRLAGLTATDLEKLVAAATRRMRAAKPTRRQARQLRKH